MRKDYKEITTTTELNAYLKNFNKIGLTVIYTKYESGLSTSENYKVLGLSLSHSVDTGIFISFDNISNLLDCLNTTIFQNCNILKIFNDIITSCKLLKHYFNITFDTNVFDICLAFQLLQKESSINFYKEHESTLYNQVRIIFQKTLPAITTNILEFIEYADYTLQIFYQLEKVTAINPVFKNHWNLCYTIESKSALFIALMECNGIGIMPALIESNLSLCTNELHKIQSKVLQLFNIDATVLFNSKYFLDYIYSNFNYRLNRLNKEQILNLMEKIEKSNQELWQILNLYITYSNIQRLINFLNRYHNNGEVLFCKFHPLSGQTGRISTTNPNLQAIPKNIAFSNLRQMFVPKDGFVFLDIDFSQIEIFIATYLSKSTKLAEVLNNKMDIHSVITSLVFDIPLEDASNKEHALYNYNRKYGKDIVFSNLYGSNRNQLGTKLKSKHLSENQIDKILYQLEDYFSEIKIWQKDLIENCKKSLSITTNSGKTIYITEINSIYNDVKKSGERRVINNIVQATASEVFKLFLIRLYEKFYGNSNFRPILTVHDEVLLEVRQEHLLEIAKEIKEIALMPPFLDYTLQVEFKISFGYSFGELLPLNI